jgi:hypothetical protein
VRRPFLLLFVGLLLVALDIPVHGIDVLPDALGYLLALLATHRLAAVPGPYRVARTLYAVATVIALAQLVLPRDTRPVTAMTVGELVRSWSIATVVLSVQAGATIAVLTGVLWAARERGAESLARQARNRRVYTLAITVALVLALLAVVFSTEALRWVVLLSTGSLLVQALVLAALIRADRELGGQTPAEPPAR